MTVRVSGVTTILTDIEGTTSPIAFVKETLFPYARARLGAYLTAHADEPDIAHVIKSAAEMGGIKDVGIPAVTALLTQWMDEDAKIQPLKELQGMIWAEGYRTGDLKGAIFDDAVARLRAWKTAGHRLAVYSSGSVLAQKLLFGGTAHGDLVPLFSAFFDTAVGAKRTANSYQRIASALQSPPLEVLFLSDVAEELDAAMSAGMKTIQLVRVGEGTASSARHAAVTTFNDIEVGSSEEAKA